MSLALSLPAPSEPAASEALAIRLRRETADAHAQLENQLQLLGRVSDRQWFVCVLEGFLGFHMVWERAIRERPELRAFLEPRSRLPHLRRDLIALGRTTAELEALPHCFAAADLAADPAEALGSIYVMEGSTLGGQVIHRALKDTGWLPRGGLTYFQPYGSRTGQMWRSYQAFAEQTTSASRQDAVCAGANRTFALLQEWLAA
ncbi:biliverdin-producing heme oxygenase [Phenylobacterium deserti]|uniref:Biliverdin-producing heme oxygenase n=2 Tax=Phenylobacterium deserti TaxID=1914756 RepID=A0A328ACU1_9CAUL|nr:biliverdin-producing heme oxygenase [Phenylobacterium deserti]